MPPIFPLENVPHEVEPVWTTAFEHFCLRIRHTFVRNASWLRAKMYLHGLFSCVERKNGWQIAEEAGEVTPYGCF